MNSINQSKRAARSDKDNSLTLVHIYIFVCREETMLRLLIAAWFVATAQAGCPLSPTSDQTSAKRLPGDGGYRILISGDYDKYIPNAVYTISLQGIKARF